MKKSYQGIVRYSGILFSLVAIGLVIRAVNGGELHGALSSVDGMWLIPVVILNFIVIVTKAFRWQVLVRPLSQVGLLRMTSILTIGFMANNVLPARIGDAMRVHMLHRKTDLGRMTTAGGLIADKILEGISFLPLMVVLFLADGIPQWMIYGISVTGLVIVGAYGLSHVYSRSRIRREFWIKLQEGLAPLHSRRVFITGFCASLASWLLQLAMIYSTQLAFGVALPFWNTVLVLVAVNLAVIVPGAPAHVGTFELACVLAYTFLGVDKNVGLLIGATYHLAQVLPVTLAGAILLLAKHLGVRKRITCALSRSAWGQIWPI